MDSSLESSPIMEMTESIARQTSFTLSLARRVGTAHARNSNLVFSPLSIHAVLGLLAAGSRGETEKQILSVLCSDSADELTFLSSQIVSPLLADGSAAGGPKLAFANGVWVDASLSLKPSFREVVTWAYKAEAKAVDFRSKANEAREDVNSWVHTLTGGLINELLPTGSVDNNTRLILGNALYFKGDWDKKFDSSQTIESDFYLLDGSTVQAPFMTTEDKQYLTSYDDFKVLRLPYKQGEDQREFSMYIFLPEARDGLWSLTQQMASESNFLDYHIPYEKVKVGKFKLPKFKISFGFEASDILKSSGMSSPFSSNAELTEMVDFGGGLYVSGIFHKSFLEVNEEGSEAAAATAAVVSTRGGFFPLELVDFVADHPFAFLIKEDMTRVVLFTGHVLNPLME